MKFRTAYEREEHEGITFKDPSLTQQQFKEQCDMNNIIARYNSTGLLIDPLHPGTRQPMFGDFSTVMDFQAAQNVVVRVNEAFEALPARVRDRFDNDPALMLEFLQNEDNREEAVKLGLINADDSGGVRIDSASWRDVGSDGFDLSGSAVSSSPVREVGLEPQVSGAEK